MSLYLAGRNYEEIVIYNATSVPYVEYGRLPHDAEVTCFDFSPDASKLVSGSSDGSLRLWDLSTCSEIVSLVVEGYGEEGEDPSLFNVAFNSLGTRVLGNNWDFIHVYGLDELSELSLLHSIRVNDPMIAHASFSGDGEHIISSTHQNDRWDEDGEFQDSGPYVRRVWNAHDGSLVRETLPPNDNFRAMGQFVQNPVQQTFFASNDVGNLVAFNTVTGEEVLAFDLAVTQNSGGGKLCVSFDGSRLCFATYGGIAAIWDTTDAHLIAHFNIPTHFRASGVCGAFDGTGTKLALSSAGEATSIRIYNTHSGILEYTVDCELFGAKFSGTLNILM